MFISLYTTSITTFVSIGAQYVMFEYHEIGFRVIFNTCNQRQRQQQECDFLHSSVVRWLFGICDVTYIEK